MRIDPERHGKAPWNTLSGIPVRAWRDADDHPHTVDLAELDTESVIEWLRSRGGHNPWAENVVLVAVGRPQVAHEYPVLVNEPVAEVVAGDGTKLEIAAAGEGVMVKIHGPEHVASTWLSVEHPRLYNAALLMIQAIHTHHEEARNESKG